MLLQTEQDPTRGKIFSRMSEAMTMRKRTNKMNYFEVSPEEIRRINSLPLPRDEKREHIRDCEEMAAEADRRFRKFGHELLMSLATGAPPAPR